MYQENSIEERIDELFYDENGNFIPLTASHGNIRGKLAFLRNTFLEAEREYLIYLLSDEHFRSRFNEYLGYSSDELFRTAMKLQSRLEYGELETEEEKNMMANMTPEERDNYHMEKLEKAEGIICLLLAAAKDKVLVKELVKTLGGRSR